MRFSCAPPERGGQQNKGDEYFSIDPQRARRAATAKGRTPNGGSASCKRWLGSSMEQDLGEVIGHSESELARRAMDCLADFQGYLIPCPDRSL
jgi:hypothetical protein